MALEEVDVPVPLFLPDFLLLRSTADESLREVLSPRAELRVDLRRPCRHLASPGHVTVERSLILHGLLALALDPTFSRLAGGALSFDRIARSDSLFNLDHIFEEHLPRSVSQG
jgi:hypothetical protein